jgi:formiminotetrahydrofolate cyclodeaminase
MSGIKDCLVKLVDEDTESFNRIMAAFQLPKDTPEQLAIRESRIQEATIGAIRVPLETASLALDVLTHLDIVLKFGNKNCLSDLAVGALMLEAGLEGALLNVETNLSAISDPEIVAGYRKTCAEFLETGELAKKHLLEEVHRRLGE